MVKIDVAGDGRRCGFGVLCKQDAAGGSEPALRLELAVSDLVSQQQIGVVQHGIEIAAKVRVNFPPLVVIALVQPNHPAFPSVLTNRLRFFRARSILCEVIISLQGSIILLNLKI